MSHFYSSIQGGRGRATRCGTKGSGLDAVAASYKGCINVTLSHDPTTGKDRYHISQERWGGAGISQGIASGFLGESLPAAIADPEKITKLEARVTDLEEENALLHDELEQAASALAALVEQMKPPPAEHGKVFEMHRGLPVGTIVKIKHDLYGICAMGDLAVWRAHTYNCDFNSMGNATVHDDGLWAVDPDDVEVVSYPSGYRPPVA